MAYDVGAHVGYFSVLKGDIAGSEGKVIAFEPRGLNLVASVHAPSQRAVNLPSPPRGTDCSAVKLILNLGELGSGSPDL